MGMIRDELKPCPICGQSVLGLRCEYDESFAYIQCNHCNYEFAAKRKQAMRSTKKLSNLKETVALWNALPRSDDKND